MEHWLSLEDQLITNDLCSGVVRHHSISLHLGEAKRLPNREHCVGNVGKYWSARKDSEWVIVVVGATVGFGGVSLRCVMEGRARETVRH